ncbi:MAG TPA: glycoside hydrolase family 31 protein [Capsulimonadaceae bacterium]|nr:glycoside hydrolase family 31 protein [Capsulimonadaceae bacterium]
MATILAEGNQTPVFSDGKFGLSLLPGEFWWGGAVNDGAHMPFGKRLYCCDLRRDLRGNQAVPLLISSKGRYIWSSGPFTFSFEDKGAHLFIDSGSSEIVYDEGHGDLPGAYRAVCRRFFPPSGRMPDALNFSAPQYNSWIEMQYEPSQEKVLRYVRDICAQGLPPGVFMIDDNWFEDHGVWRFHPARFPDPAAMVREMHEYGFQIMLWVSPFISPDSDTYRELKNNGYLVRDQHGFPVVREWWNGHSAMLDVTHPGATDWLLAQLSRLTEEIGIDGFKLDAGDPEYISPSDQTYSAADAVSYCEEWARLGLGFRFSESRACWKLAGTPLVQRLRDKFHDWGRDGLADIIPNGLAQSLAGYSFTCPDMVGGGDIGSFTRAGFELDQELFVRTLQCSLLFPIMQFSIAPWRVLDAEHWGYCKQAIELRQNLAPLILQLARDAATTGEPILRHMAYVFPGCGFEEVSDQFLLGNELLVAPVIERGASHRSVVVPPGRWIAEDGTKIEGPGIEDIPAPLSRLPWFLRAR